MIGAFCATVARVIYVRLASTSEGNLELSSEAVWGMIGFASLPVFAALGALYAAWEARHPRKGAPWDDVDIERIGGSL